MVSVPVKRIFWPAAPADLGCRARLFNKISEEILQMGFGRITNTIAVDNIPARGLGGGEWATPGPSGQMPGAGVPLHVPFT